MSSRDDLPPFPYAIRGKISRCEQIFDTYELRITDSTGFLRIVHVWPDDMPAMGNRPEYVTLWRGTNRFFKYIAFDDHIVETAYNENAVLDFLTQQHFDAYKQMAKEHRAIKERLDEIQKKISMINMINAESNAAVEMAKKTLTDHLTGQMAALRQEKKQYKLR